MKPKIFLCGIKMFLMLVAVVAGALQFAAAQKKEVVWSADEKPLADQIHGLRGLPDDVRAGTTKDLALKIRKLPATENKLRLAVGLAGLSTEGDFGHDTLQEVATTLAQTLRERPMPWAEPKNSNSDAGSKAAAREPAYPYIELATLVRYEHVEASLDDMSNFARPWPASKATTANGNIQTLPSKIFLARPGRLGNSTAKLYW